LLAYFGELHPGVLKNFGIEGRALGFEILIDSLPFSKRGKFIKDNKLELSAFQAVERDFAFIVDMKVAAETLINAVQVADKKLITEIKVFDLFVGEGIEKGKKSIAISALLQPMKATLTDPEIEAVCDKIISNVQKQAGGKLRS
jgi:phenylalanyl-tRNA synthetase beta chain